MKKLSNFTPIKMNLQYFAEGDESGESGNDAGGQGEQPKAVTFESQKMLDEMIAKRVQRAEASALKKYQESDEYKELLSLKESKLSEDEKVKAKLGKLDEVQSEIERLRQENADYKNRSLITGLKDPGQVEFIQFKVNKMVNDKVDFEEAFETFKKENPDYFGDSSNQGGGNFQYRHNQSNSGGNSEKSYLDSKYKGNRYYQK